jgi:predicted RNA-binding Zn ribbon-like protein
MKQPGKPSPAISRAAMIGGSYVLEFVNTVGWRTGAEPVELLASPADLVLWARRMGLVGRAEAERLRGATRRRPAAAARLLRRARELREALYDVFVAMAARRRAPSHALARLNRELGRALRRPRLEPAGQGYTLRYAQMGLERVLAEVVRAGADLLTSDRVRRVKQCAGAGCGWLFLDRSRNGSRRWCEMADCGNREKVRRFYRRRRAAAGAARAAQAGSESA